MSTQFKLTALAAVLAVSAGAQAGTVDLFSTEQLLAKDYTNGGIDEASSIYSQAGAALDTTILGGYRDLWVTNLSGGITNVAGSSINVTNGNLYFSSDTSATGVGEVQWDGDDSATGTNPVYDINYTGLGGVDITNGGGLNAFELTTIFSDLNWSFEITIYTDATNWTKINLDANSVGPTGTYSAPHVSYIPFAAFTNDLLCGTYGADAGVNGITCGGTGANLLSVGAVVARINAGDPLNPNPALRPATVAVDLQLDSIKTVPEPGVLALVGVGLLAGGLARRGKKAAA